MSTWDNLKRMTSVCFLASSWLIGFGNFHSFFPFTSYFDHSPVMNHTPRHGAVFAGRWSCFSVVLIFSYSISFHPPDGTKRSSISSRVKRKHNSTSPSNVDLGFRATDPPKLWQSLHTYVQSYIKSFFLTIIQPSAPDGTLTGNRVSVSVSDFAGWVI